MTRKDYVLLANAISMFERDDEREPIRTASGGVEYVAYAIADALANDNPRFDRARFLKACGVQS